MECLKPRTKIKKSTNRNFSVNNESTLLEQIENLEKTLNQIDLNDSYLANENSLYSTLGNTKTVAIAKEKYKSIRVIVN
jgi:hypothetical protein